MDEAEDLVQECLIAYWEKAPEVSSTKSYLYSMVRNRCIDILRKKSVSVPLQEDIPDQKQDCGLLSNASRSSGGSAL